MSQMHDTGDERILLAVDNRVATLTLARPEKLNALDFAMVAALERAAQIIESQENVRVALITGQGDKSFCAGGDIEAWSTWTPDEFAMRWVRQGHRAFDALAQLSVPLIAVLNGHCLGGGLELALVADLRVAESHIKIGQPESGLGIIPGWSGTQRAVRRLGAQLVRRMALGGEIFSAEQAFAQGIVDSCVATGEGMPAALRLAEKICHRGPLATKLTKLMINGAEGEEVAAAMEALGGHIAAASSELAEGIAAFKAKRKPVF